MVAGSVSPFRTCHRGGDLGHGLSEEGRQRCSEPKENILTTYTKPVIPAGLEQALRELGRRGLSHPDAVVDHARTVGMFRQSLVTGPNARDTAAADLAYEKVQLIAEQACACSVEVRPTNEYHPCMCWAGSVMRRLDRFLVGCERKARANITIG